MRKRRRLRDDGQRRDKDLTDTLSPESRNPSIRANNYSRNNSRIQERKTSNNDTIRPEIHGSFSNRDRKRGGKEGEKCVTGSIDEREREEGRGQLVVTSHVCKDKQSVAERGHRCASRIAISSMHLLDEMPSLSLSFVTNRPLEQSFVVSLLQR